MSEENTGADQPTDAASTDDRFEVKWRKKSSSPPPPPPAAGEQAPSEDVEALRGELEAERERVRDLQDRWHRAQADLANLRRRTEQERGDMEKFAAMLTVAELLPVLDNFERALATIPGNLQMLTWIQGVMLIERHFRSILEHLGVQPIETQGQQFSPHLHEAISERETDEAAPGTIMQEYQRGYTMHGRVLRPSLVEVAAAPKAQEAPQEQPPADEDNVTTPEEGEEIAEEAETENVGP